MSEYHQAPAYKPLVSVVIPVYNREQYVGEAIESILNQSSQEFELIIIDDSSTDNSPLIIEQYRQSDKRIRYIRQANGGPSKARNTGIQAASTEYIAFMDDDDRSMPDLLEKQYQFLKENPNVQSVNSLRKIFKPFDKSKITHTTHRLPVSRTLQKPGPELYTFFRRGNNFSIGIATMAKRSAC